MSEVANHRSEQPRLIRAASPTSPRATASSEYGANHQPVSDTSIGPYIGQKAIPAFWSASTYFNGDIMQTSFRNAMVIAALGVGIAPIVHAQDAYVARWQSVIGIIQASNVVGTGTGAVTGAPGPWSAQGGHVVVDLARGKVEFTVRGLVLAGGNSIGNTGAVDQVKGTLVCDTNGSASAGNSVLVDTPLVALDDDGDARFQGSMTIPAVCAAEPDIAFLIRTASGRWIGNAAVLR